MSDEPVPVVVQGIRGGGRAVVIHGQQVAIAYSRADVWEALRLAGLDDPDLMDPGLVDWEGGGPDEWPEPPPAVR